MEQSKNKNNLRQETLSILISELAVRFHSALAVRLENLLALVFKLYISIITPITLLLGRLIFP